MKIKDKVVKEVVDKFTERSRVGVVKYDVTLEKSPEDFSAFLNHLQEELMDATLYIQKLKAMVKDGEVTNV